MKEIGRKKLEKQGQLHEAQMEIEATKRRESEEKMRAEILELKQSLKKVEEDLEFSELENRDLKREVESLESKAIASKESEKGLTSEVNELKKDLDLKTKTLESFISRNMDLNDTVAERDKELATAYENQERENKRISEERSKQAIEIQKLKNKNKQLEDDISREKKERRTKEADLRKSYEEEKSQAKKFKANQKSVESRLLQLKDKIASIKGKVRTKALEESREAYKKEANIFLLTEQENRLLREEVRQLKKEAMLKEKGDRIYLSPHSKLWFSQVNIPRIETISPVSLESENNIIKESEVAVSDSEMQVNIPEMLNECNIPSDPSFNILPDLSWILSEVIEDNSQLDNKSHNF